MSGDTWAGLRRRRRVRKARSLWHAAQAIATALSIAARSLRNG